MTHELHSIYAHADATGLEMWVACSCGWKGPRRHLNDRWCTGLLSDDRDWHDEQISKEGPWVISK